MSHGVIGGCLSEMGPRHLGDCSSRPGGDSLYSLKQPGIYSLGHSFLSEPLKQAIQECIHAVFVPHD